MLQRVFHLIAPILLFSSISPAQQAMADDPAKLLNHLAGRWVMTGTLGGKQTTHDVDADSVLKGEYLRMHEVSREKDASGSPAYEAIVFLSWNTKLNQYTCMWLDNTAGGGLSPQGIALGPKAGDAVPLVFTISPQESLHTTFSYDERADSWRLTIDDVTDGKTDRFGDVRLTRAQKPTTRAGELPQARSAAPTTKDR
jgi:hypothetical protein